MSATTNGFVCDRCGTDVGGGGVDTCVIVSDLDPDPDRMGQVRNRHFCVERDDELQIVGGCAQQVPDDDMHHKRKPKSTRSTRKR